MNEQRKDEIGSLFIKEKEISEEKLKGLEIQEIIFLIFSARYFREKQTFTYDNYEGKLHSFFKVLWEKIISAEELFIAYDQNTDSPYIDERDRIWMFSKEEFTLNAQNYSLKKLLALEMKKISKEEIMITFANLHRLGIKKIIMDNGEYATEVFRDDILPPYDWSETPERNIPVENSELQHAMLRFFQTLYSKGNYQGKEQLLNQLEDRMFDQVIKAKYLIPMQLKEEVTSIPNEDGIITLKKGTSLQFGSLVGNNDTSWQPAFTDWPEFEKAYDKNIWNGNIGTYDDLLTLSEKMEGVIINCKGICFQINKRNKMKIEEYKNALR